MPLHDWTNGRAGEFHDFHQGWVAELRSSLNQFDLPPGYSAMLQRCRVPVSPEEGSEDTFYDSHKNQVVVCREGDFNPVAIIRMVSSGNKQNSVEIGRFTDEVMVAIDSGVHLLIVDLFPPLSQDPNGIHGAICERLEEPYRLPKPMARTQVAYRSGQRLQAYVETLGVGDDLASMPLFLTSDQYILVPLADTYAAALAGIPAHVRRTLQQTLPH